MKTNDEELEDFVSPDDPLELKMSIKHKGRIKRRNRIAKAMLEDRRRFGERVIKSVKKDGPKFNKSKILKGIYEDDKE